MKCERPTDVCLVGAAVYFLPVRTRMPLKFGAETLTEVDCCRVRVTVRDRRGRTADGWGETPLSAQWAWPADLPYATRAAAMRDFAVAAVRAWTESGDCGHPLDLGVRFQANILPKLVHDSLTSGAAEPLPYLAALIALSAADVAVHDAYGNLQQRDVFDVYSSEYMPHDLTHYFGFDAAAAFSGKFPSDYLASPCPQVLPVWHLVGGLDPLTFEEVDPQSSLQDSYPLLLVDWIKRDGLRCLKVKLRGNDAEWDFQRLVQVGQLGIPLGVEHYSADFNCTVRRPEYVVAILERLRRESPPLFERLLYVEQPFPYDLTNNQIDVRSVSQIKPLFLDESAHDWRYVKLGRSLGWTGVCLKTCKTQTGSILSYCWARAHGMQIMVQDLTNPMLAQIPHVRLASKVHSIMGVESNAMQFYPDASLPEARVHPGMYRRRNGQIDLSTLGEVGFGYRLAEIERQLPEPAALF